MVRLGTVLVAMSTVLAIALGGIASIGVGVWTGAIAPFQVSATLGKDQIAFDTPIFCPDGLAQPVCDTLPGQLPRALRLQLLSPDNAPLALRVRLPSPTRQE